MDNINTNYKTAIMAITKKGISIAKQIQNQLDNSDIYVPEKFSNSGSKIMYFPEPVSQKLGSLFSNYSSIICIFSLGAVIRLISPYLRDKKSDPAIVVIDDTAKFVISALSGHLGGANELTLRISGFLNSIPVITTAADVNNTIAIDLLGKKFGWIIEDMGNVTKVSAMMVNEEKIGVFQDSGERDWWDMDKLPKNVTLVSDVNDLLQDDIKGAIVISDKIITNKIVLNKSVLYRPKSLVVGVGLHWNTTEETIQAGITKVLKESNLSFNSIKSITSLEKGKRIRGLDEYCQRYDFPLILFAKDKLDKINVPNPSEIVGRFEGTSSVSEASSITGSNGSLIVPKYKFPPDLTVAISRVRLE
ncbi:cobalt-precorrin 5A hydrolase [Candidatus Nitrosocosmicus hydrocola]|uniref:cobalt-precorrin 5A hydrolase n=1 Tax=Candidatus Nitrosocosmicus hydrocola TaxID=1826872 RepID=UPI000AC00441|nr:cobalamin biosynthesis protein [Candidatus Nitrosocosmicus hydrocola]